MTAPKICMVGSSMMDLIARVPRLPAAGETLVGSAFQMGFGGKGSNQAVMAARLGAEVAVVVKLGHDVFGENTLKNYHHHDIDTEFVMFDDVLSSGVAPIAVDENTGQNSIIIVPGANLALSPDDVRSATRAIHSADVLICQLEIKVETTLEAFRIAHNQTDKRITTILNPAPAVELPDDLLRLTDIFVPNEVEAAMLSGMPTGTIDEAIAAAQALQQRGVKSVVMTLGERGSLIIERDQPPQHIPAQQVKAVDTTGAGDAFVGSLAYFIGKALTLQDAAERAGTIATRSVLKIGTQTSFPYQQEVADLL